MGFKESHFSTQSVKVTFAEKRFAFEARNPKLGND